MRTRDGLLAVAALAAGSAAGAAIEELAYRRAFRRRDAEAHERIGSRRGRSVEIRTQDGVRLVAETFGPEGTPSVVLAHGLTLARDAWHYQIAGLAGRFRVVVYDARGHGASGSAQGPLGMARLSSDLRDVVRHTVSGPCVLVGHSMGGMTVIELARDGLPAEVSGVVLLNTSSTGTFGMRPGDRRRRKRVRAVLGTSAAARVVGAFRWPDNDLTTWLTRATFGPAASPSHVHEVSRMVRRTQPEAIVACLRAIAGWDATDLLGEIDVPAIVVAGERDLLTPRWLSETIVRALPDARLVVLPGCGHQSLLERHAEITRLIDGHASRVLAAAS